MRYALGRRRRDVMRVERPVAAKNAYGAQRETLKVVYEAAPCRLSFFGRLSFLGEASSADTARLPDVSYTAAVFHDPDIEIHVNDRVTVLREGREYAGLAGESAVYPSSVRTPVLIHRR